MTELPRARVVSRRAAISLPAVFIVVWVAYLILLGTRADEVFGPFHNDTFWPADTYLTSAQPGLAIRIFGHVMVTLVGVRIYAWVGADRELVVLGLRDCPGPVAECLGSGDEAIKAIAIDLGREITKVETNKDNTVRVFVFATKE